MFSIEEVRFTSISRKQAPFCCTYSFHTYTKIISEPILVVYVAGIHLPFDSVFKQCDFPRTLLPSICPLWVGGVETDGEGR